MKRSVRAAIAVAILALLVPAAALAMHHGGSHHHGRHGFQHGASGPSGATGANTVSSYSGGTLVLALAGGGSITGTVSDRTRFVCPGRGWGERGGRGGRVDGRLQSRRNDAPSITGTTGTTGPTGWSGPTGPTGPTGGGGTGGFGHHHHGDSGSGGGGWSGEGGDSGSSGGWSGHHGATGATGGGGYTPPPPCDSSLLVPGQVVSSAEVLVTANGVLFGELLLLPAVQ